MFYQSHLKRGNNMPLHIIKEDITKIKCDCIVNPTNPQMIPGGGADAAIHKAAGPELLEYCKTLGTLAVGEAKITPAFSLPSKYIIHTAGPIWEGGLAGERVLLRSCYSEAMKLAIQQECQSVAFPLISSGLYGYPKDSVMREAKEVISSFLDSYEMDVFILVFDKEDYSIDEDFKRDLQTFVDKNCAERDIYRLESRLMREDSYASRVGQRRQATLASRERREVEELSCATDCSFGVDSLDEMLGKMDKGFADTLFYYIDKKGITDVEAYKRSNVGKKTFSKIKCNKDYKPSKITAVSFAIGLRLNLRETEHLLSTAGMCLSHSNKFDVIIEYFILSGRYETIFDVNEVLYQFDQSLLGV